MSSLLDEYLALLEGASAFEGSPPSMGAIAKEDCLIVVDMQNDFVPAVDAPVGGRFGVAEGAQAAAAIVPLIEKFSAAGATIVATRDYHPKEHSSFNTSGGPFPEHCLQGGAGSEFFPTIADALTAARKVTDVRVVFKGFSESVDSFGAFPYPEDYASGRLSHAAGAGVEAHPSFCNPGTGIGCSLPFTGAFELKMSSAEETINAPPDVLAILSRKPLQTVLAGKRRLFVVGLALDFCVLDTAVTATVAGFTEVFIVVDAARAAHIPGVGTEGSGFLTPAAQLAATIKKYSVRLVRLSAL